MSREFVISSLIFAAVLVIGLSGDAHASALPKLSIANVTVSEASCSSQVATFTVTVSAPFGKNGTVQFASADGTPIAGIDYTAVSGTLSFARGSKSPQTFTVPITNVLIPGASKIFYVNLTNPQNATLTNSQATGTIVAPTVAKCQSCGISCSQGDACFTDSCDAVRGCQHVNTSATGAPWCEQVQIGGTNFTTCASRGLWADSDGDGLPDAAEAQGYIDNNANGVYDAGIDIPLTGADPNKPDVFLHYDYTVASDHNHNPPAQAIQWVVDAFAANGINLHIDPQHNAICENAGDAGCITAGTGARVVTLANPTDSACTGPTAVSAHQLREAIPGLTLLKPAYHYMVFGHYATCDPSVDPNTGQPYCSACPNDPENPACGSVLPARPAPDNLGTAEVYGDDAIVATRAFSDVGLPIPLEAWAGLSMHEFGHNFGLEHGGADCYNAKPNYVSVMNYSFYTKGIPVGASPGDIVPKSCASDADCISAHPTPAHCSLSTGTCFRIDYSDRIFNNLNEATGINEELGLQGGVDNTDISWTHAAGQFVQVPTNGAPIDFNGDGNTTDTNLIYDVNGDVQKTLLATQNDWTHLQFAYQCQPTYADDLVIPRDLRFGKEGPMVAVNRPTFEQLFQSYWQKAAQMQPAESGMSNTIPRSVDGPSRTPPANKREVDLLHERSLFE